MSCPVAVAVAAQLFMAVRRGLTFCFVALRMAVLCDRWQVLHAILVVEVLALLNSGTLSTRTGTILVLVH